MLAATSYIHCFSCSRRSASYTLRERHHDYQLSCRQNSVTDKNFITRLTTVIQRRVSLICHIISKHRLSFVVEQMLSFRFRSFLLAM